MNRLHLEWDQRENKRVANIEELTQNLAQKEMLKMMNTFNLISLISNHNNKK